MGIATNYSNSKASILSRTWHSATFSIAFSGTFLPGISSVLSQPHCCPSPGVSGPLCFSTFSLPSNVRSFMGDAVRFPVSCTPSFPVSVDSLVHLPKYAPSLSLTCVGWRESWRERAPAHGFQPQIHSPWGSCTSQKHPNTPGDCKVGK